MTKREAIKKVFATKASLTNLIFLPWNMTFLSHSYVLVNKKC